MDIEKIGNGKKLMKIEIKAKNTKTQRIYYGVPNLGLTIPGIYKTDKSIVGPGYLILSPHDGPLQILIGVQQGSVFNPLEMTSHNMWFQYDWEYLGEARIDIS